jgi:hypothetical protein
MKINFALLAGSIVIAEVSGSAAVAQTTAGGFVPPVNIAGLAFGHYGITIESAKLRQSENDHFIDCFRRRELGAGRPKA